MKQYDCIILTETQYINPKEIDIYVQNVLDEDALIQSALESLGLKVKRVAWDDPNFDWPSTKSAIFRATWDYFHRFKAFSKWLEKASKETLLINSEAIIRWNIDKHYLQDLQKKGVHIAETHFIEQGTSTTLKVLHSQLGWKETVLKPCVSGGARHTYKLNAGNLETLETIFQELIANEAMMLQPFQYNIVEKGEVSMMVFNGQYTHSVLKIAKAGDFRVQDDYGGTVHDYTPTKADIAFAEQAVNACDELPMYARVDFILDNDNKLALLELELLEPELWFRNHHHAATVLAEGINNKLNALT